MRRFNIYNAFLCLPFLFSCSLASKSSLTQRDPAQEAAAVNVAEDARDPLTGQQWMLKVMKEVVDTHDFKASQKGKPPTFDQMESIAKSQDLPKLQTIIDEHREVLQKHFEQSLFGAKKQPGVARFLLDNAKRYLNLERSLELAMRSNNLPVGELLVSYRVNVNAGSYHERPIRIAAVQMQSMDWVDLLIEAGAKVRIRSPRGEFRDGGVTMLHELAAARGVSVDRKILIVRRLVAAGARVGAKNFKGQAPLHITAIWGTVDMARAFVEEGANLHATDRNGETPVQQELRGNVNNPEYKEMTTFLLGEAEEIAARRKSEKGTVKQRLLKGVGKWTGCYN